MGIVDISDWGEILVADLFEHIERGKGSGAGSFIDGNYPYIAASFSNNGYVREVDDASGSLISDGNCIAMIVNGNGGVGRNTYQPKPFVGSSDLQLGYHHRLNQWNGLFLVSCLNKSIERYNYSFSWKRTGESFARETVFLPVLSDGSPDWDAMEQIMCAVVGEQEERLDLVETLAKSTPVSVDINSWAEFRIDQIFNVVKGSRLRSADRIPGDIPYVGASQFNNGITHYISNDEHIHPAGVLTVCYNGPVGTTFYQPNPFWATDDVNVLYPLEKTSPESLLFVAPIIEQVGAKYAYVDKWKLADMKAAVIKLPVDATGGPDWKFMESYMSALIDKKASDLDIFSGLGAAPSKRNGSCSYPH
ncbi:restriction endonuclease subunit S [uncultured Varibaculum sp.]|uniref:restriction endonuclease subunit S n=1 Tax=uncultured Varibaculum sp. TaxID=413896 RepID=UPI0028898C11|nr:restriction endonuclease subunit S [uncultured Varibaculum sp.]